MHFWQLTPKKNFHLRFPIIILTFVSLTEQFLLSFYLQTAKKSFPTSITSTPHIAIEHGKRSQWLNLKQQTENIILLLLSPCIVSLCALFLAWVATTSIEKKKCILDKKRKSGKTAFPGNLYPSHPTKYNMRKGSLPLSYYRIKKNNKSITEWKDEKTCSCMKLLKWQYW